MNTAQELRDIEEAILEAGAAQRTTQEAQRPAQAPLHAPAAEPIAIVGLSGFFPGCQSVDQFWQALDRDASLIEEIPPSRFDWRNGAGRSRWGGFIPDIAGFDPAFFGIPPGEAITMDPRQRLLLMSAYQTLGDAGYAPRSLKRSRTGVFVAIQDNEYLKLLEAAGIDTGEWYAQTSLLANRLSYFFDFRGASEVVDAQCPGAAVAIHRAVNALRLGELDQALVGAANLLLTPEPFALLSESGQLSPTSSVGSFGSRAQGHLRSEGVASVLLKPLSRALADNDHVYALIRSTAVNYNGQGGASIAAPNLESHVEVIKDCYRRAGIDPRHVRYIEAQGMGNVLADLVEWRAFNRALGELAQQERLTLEPGACRVSTVKPMMGHMESASALGALFKVVRSLKSGVVHKVADFTDYHPDMEREGEPCAIAEQTAPWPRIDGPRLAGVHCYGMGGINAHLLVEEFEPALRERKQPRPALIVLSARSEASLAAMVRELHQHLRENTEEQLGDIAFTLQVGREELEHRLAWVVASRQELQGKLENYLAGPRPPAALAGGKNELQELATHWLEGGAVAWASLHEGRHPKRVRLPAYPFDKQPYWIGGDRPSAGTRDIEGSLVAMLGEALQLAPGAIDCKRHLYDFGIDSLLGMKLLRGLARRFDVEVQARDLVEHPTIEALAAHLGRKLPRQRSEGTAPVESMALSEGQQGLWALQQLAPDMSAYNIPLCFHIAQPVDIAALTAALHRLLDEHPLLASRFVEQGAALARETRRNALIAFEHQDVAGFDVDRLHAHIASIARKPFDLATDLPIRAHLLSSGLRDHRLLITLHHIVFDGGSFLPVCRSLFSAYREIREGKASAAAVEDLYPQFVAWERQMLAGGEGARHRAYWMGQLAGPLPVTSLFADFPRAASRPFAGQSHSVRLDPVLSRRLRTFARQQRMTLSTLFLALFKVVLHRHSGEDDIIVGMAERGRSQERFESAVGYFINMLPIRTRDVGSKPFAGLLRELQLTMADALDHEAYPFPRMVRDLGIMPDDGIAPVFQVAFEYQNAFSNGDLLAFNREFGEALGVTLMEEVGQEGEYELVLEVREGADDFLLNIKFNPTLFKSSTISALAGHLMTAAEQAMAEPDRLSSELDLIPARERKLLLEDWNRTGADYPKDQCVHQLFAQQILRTPQAVAVVCDGQELSYAELDARSTSLANYLQHRGVQPEQIVAICVERSLEMVVALLAVAKAGAAWLPLDPQFPAERLRFMLDDSRTSLVLTQSAIRPMLTDVAAISLDTEWDAIEERASGVDLRVQANASHLAYVIYTSGSTGVPKGVMVEHRGLTNFLCSMAKRPGFTAGDRLLAVTTYSFDIAALELLLPLVRGGTCLICPTDRAGDADLLRKEIRQLRPTIMQATPSTWTMLFASGWRNEERMKLLCGGEPLPPALKQQFVASGSEAWNMFGPTETTIWSTIAPVTSGDAGVSIGTPIANTRIHILDRFGRLAPLGVPGELCIGGDGLARGYLGNPALTAEKFIANPFEPGTRLYRTGDLARWREEGALEHLGRLDHQVKIRGHRVELEEIETWLDRHASVVQSVVVSRAQQGSQQLVAYYVARTRPATPQQLKEHLTPHLPDYMIPALYVALPELPLTANGKTDRKALAAREPVVQRVEAAPVSDSRIEQELLAMWRTLLEVGSLGVDDRFFELGGNSVTAVILARQIGDRFGVEFRAPDLFKYPTVREVARLVAQPAMPRPVAVAPEAKERPRQAGGTPDYYRDSLAIVGISCHLPGARTPAQFWENLRQGRESSTPLSLDELRRAGVSDEVLNDPNFVPLQYSMDGKDLFDPAFFNISPKNAVFMDPQFRVLLQHAWQAIEDAGYAAQSIPDTAVFMSASNGFYKTLLHNSGKVDAADEYAAWIAGQGGTIPTMVSYQLGFKGPSLSVHSNCSSSLVALYLANQALRAGEARCALVGAASLFPIPGAGHFHLPGMNLSSDGHCRTFDAAADGLVGGEGVAVVMVKKALDAIEDGDHIYALVRGVAVNNDGSDKAGFYAPSVTGQAAAIDKVLTATGIDPESIGYVEAHGTGTRLGDPIEVMALNEVYRRYTDRKQFCRIGSVKPNIGHLDTAAGLAGLIKVALSLRHGEIPPSINYSTPNPDIDFASSAFSVVDRLSPWPETGEPRRAALSSFGIGGTNAHAVLEEYRAGQNVRTESEQLIVLSALTEDQLKVHAGRLLEHVRGVDRARLDLRDMAFTLQTGRKPMAWRAAFQASTLDELASQLERFASGVAGEGCVKGHVRPAGESAPVADREDADHLVARWLSNGRLDKLATAWVGGLEFDWSTLHRDGDARRVSLPTYPFAEERYWVEAGTPVVRASTNLLLAHPVWKHRPVETASPPVYGRRVRLEPKPSGATQAERYRSLCVQVFEALKPIVAELGVRTLFQVVYPGGEERSLYAGLAGLLKTARLENPGVVAQLIETAADDIAATLDENARCPDDIEIRYDGRQRMVPEWETLPDTAVPGTPWKEGGVYLLTGGAGALGLIFAEEIARQVSRATLVLAHRSDLTARQSARIDALRSKGVVVVARKCDVSRQDEVDALVAEIVAAHRTINGILHCAGIVCDNWILKKTVPELKTVLAAKVDGAVNLDRATRVLDLDFFVAFSSAATVHGSAGQADYCAANAFLDEFTGYRGRAITIGWPLWRDGGMRPDAASEQAMREATGLMPLPTSSGMQAFYRSLASGRARTLVLEGDSDAIRRWLMPSATPTVETSGPEILRTATTENLKGLIAQAIRMPVERIDPLEPLGTYGIDSIAIVRLNQQLEKIFGRLPKTLFFQFQTIEALVGYLLQHHGDGCAAWTGQAADAPPVVVTSFARAIAPPVSTDDPIAIIGIAGRYPQADTLDAFWDNLKAGRDCIGEIPSDRWAMDGFFEADAKKAAATGRSYSRWGGFLDGFAEFDPLFFNISPKEALAIDPQERLFLQCAWHALEDAGYTRDSLQELNRRNVGVFVGVTKTGFELHGPELWRQGKLTFPHTSFSSVANRVSYCLNLRGPSMPIDTMCSASLTAIHEACQHIRHGDCDMAIAGGVNLYLHPSSYVGLCSVFMLSKDGQCRSFGEGGNGFVPGEGVGAILLKRLSHAVRDGDRIHAVIRASSVNHGGKTNGYTVPNPTAQAELITDCLRKAGIEASSIGYVEAHGTGTELGDPIEVAGLTEAFRHDTSNNGFCVLGSVKSNIGHLEAAAGIAGLTKIVLQMRHGVIAPSLHARTLNPNIDFADTPFVVQQELGPWRQGAEPRRAGLSSFGAGGANAHVVIEEYVASEVRYPSREEAALIVLSARTGERLKQVAVDLLKFLERDTLPLHDIAYTLQVGREAFRERLGFVASSLAELKQKLTQFVEREAAPASGDKFLDRWVKGESVDWSALYPGEKPRRVGLPGYPFARQRLWVDDQLQLQPAPADLLLMRPVWDAVAVTGETWPAAHAKVAIVGGMPDQQQAIRRDFANAVVAEESTITTLGRLDHVVWLASSDILSLFRLVKTLLAQGYGTREFGLTVITTQALAVHDRDPNDATQAAIHGLAGSLAREYPAWQVRALDVAADAPWPVPDLWRVPPLRGESHAWRGEWLRQKLVRLPSLLRRVEIYRPAGVYVVIGGAGALGEVWTRMMVRDHQARVVWLGRSPLDAAIQARLDTLGSLGPRPDYIQADARDTGAMADALRSIKAKHGAIHGLIVSTLGPYDQGLAQMSEALFRDILSSKRDVALCVADCFRNEPLDFIAFFSSMAAFGRPAGMAAYASACVFADAFAHQLARERPGTVKVIDWGYWDAGGGVRISGALKSLVEHRGVQPIEAAQGLEALEATLGAPFVQLAVTRTSKPELVETYDGEEQVALSPPSSRSCIDALVAWRPSEAAPKPGDAANELNGWIARLLHAQLKSVGGGTRLAKYDRWWDESQNVLRQYGLSVGSASPDAGEVWEGWRARKPYFLGHSETRTLAVLIEDCLRELPGILSGRTLVTDILFPNGSMEKIEGLYKNNEICDYFNSVVAGAIETYIERRVHDDPAARIRLIEIGAGTGGTTSTILPRLKRWQRHIAEYCYTDLSRSFFNHARRRYGDDYPYLDYRLCDIERPLAEQGIAVGSYDVAVATNVLHATRSMRNTLRNAKAALRDNGLLILNEISDKTVFASVLFGLIDGWSLAEDGQWRIPGSPGLYPASWRSLLLQEGFTSVLFPAEPAHALGQQIVVAESDGLVRQRVSARSPEPQPAPVVESAPDGTDEDVQGAILEALASSLSIDCEAIELDVAFSDYGVDSILGVGFVQQVNKALGLSLATTVLFDHSTVARLARHIGAEHRPVVASRRDPEPAPVPSSTDGIAVIGMSGQFPGARNVEEFWRNMVGDVDPVVELPERYLERQAFSPQKQPGKSYCKWGGILETRDCFDPMFFNISPREAESMNPHQRLVLLESWKALEDAGYNPKSLARSRTGVFVGCEPSAYVHETFTGASDAIVASRLSYFLDLNGPAFVVNTGCSSSGVALHLACEALRNNEADLALAGGAFAVMGQTILVGLSQTEMLSRGGRCRSFDADADGMVMSEGVGMVALKRLDQALADGDAIHGVIRASGTNQDGASNGITAPSGTAQQQLIADVYRRHRIDPERISYVEAHGTGTRLGDPVEANALVKAFRQFTSKTGYCAVGSSKSHIGHTSANAGVAGLISILLSLKHHRLPALRYFKTLNPLIQFEGSPFYPNTVLSDWRSTDGQPLMAALNSFGHSGTNVHLVVEEHVGATDVTPAETGRPELIVVSAKDEERLPEALGNLRTFIRTTTASLADIAYTLQTGREALEHRAAFVVQSLAELDRLLTSVLSGDASGQGVWTGHVGPRRKPAPAVAASGRSVSELAAAWVQGADIDWASLAHTGKSRRLHLPTYPFARERYWKPQGQPAGSAEAILHPLVHHNVSTLNGLAFESNFTGAEFFFADHLVQGEKVLPGVAYLEMARAALAHAQGRGSQFEPVRLENIVWTAPLSPSAVTIAFEAPRAGAIAYRISSNAGLHHQGLLREAPPVAPPPLDLPKLRSAIGRTVDAEACYAALADAGVRHGPIFKALRTIHVGSGQVLAKLMVEPDAAYVLHPALMDAALQATVALALDAPGDRPVLLPFALDALDVLGLCEPVMWAWIRLGNGPQKLDIDLCTEAGEVRVHLSGLTSRALSPRQSGCDVAHFYGSEFFLKDHGGMLPAAVYLELARAAAARQGSGVVSALTNIVWPTPMMVGAEGGDLATSLRPDGAFAMTSGSVLHCQGRAILDEAVSPDARAIHAIQSRCGTVLDKAACDALLHSTHGPSLLSIEHLRHNGDEALALLELPVEQGDFHLHPSLLNGAILASVVWTLTSRPGAELPWPFSLEALRIFGKLPSRLFAHVRRHSSAAAREVVDIDLLDPDGRCVASFERFTILFKEASEGTVFATPAWVDRPLVSAPGIVAAPTVVLAERDEALRGEMLAKWPGAHIEVLRGPDAEGNLLDLFERCQKAATGPLLLLIPEGRQAALHNGLVALLKTLRLEQPRTAAKVIRNARLVSQIAAEMAPSDDVEIRYDNDGRRQVRTLSEIALADTASAFQPGDVVWITGGLGGIGRVVARHLGLARKARLILSGRSSPDADGQRFLDGLGQDGVEVTYLQVDVAEPSTVKAAVAEIERRLGGLQGIIHSAGTIADDYVSNKTADQVARVLRPKVAGALMLDEATRHLNPKYFVLFSSIAGVQGNLGQADYASANAFLDGFAQWRNANVGRTISIDWPLWRDGGMRMGAANAELMRQATGMLAMDAESGLRALERCVASDRAQVLVAYGDTARIRERLLSSPAPSSSVEPDVLHDDLGRKLASSVRTELVRLVAEVQRIRPEKVSLQRDLSDYGFDSISFTEFANALNRTYALTLMPTLFFEIPDLEALAEHLITLHPQALLKKYSLATPPIVATPARKVAPVVVSPTTIDNDAIAVIGMAGKFPGAADPDELWRQLDANRDLISEVPATRWDWREIYGDPHAEPGKTRVKWGGFVVDADCFDAAFFGISPAEAEAMDPQLRLFLETVWSALEDAGYAASALSGSRTGVFAGVATADYKELWAEARRNGLATSPAEPFPFMVANRVSYQFNFHGPSEVVDTACSSSLIAIHRAIESLRHGNCDVALAGGVNVMASPRITIASSQAGILSEDGRCMTFDHRANGYVRSEGVAVVMLKPIGKALADGDRILGVIRASGENHGGRAASPTAPNAAAQKQLLVDVYSRAGIDPTTIGYIEAHGTGTSLGDPVEVNGLKAAFAELYRLGGLEIGPVHCALGSVKANIGHLEAAAGAAGLIKVLLMLRHRRIPGNPQLKTPNPYLQLDGTPFHLVAETRDWAEGVTPRRAGVSSFGVGGSNAHVVVEEYRAPASAPSKSSPVLIVLSAKDEERLRDQASRLARFITDKSQEVSLADLAYTLQVGREAMSCRLAFLAASLDEVEHGLLHAEVTQHDDRLQEISADEDMAATFDAWIAKGKHDKLLDAWLKGFRFDWNRLYDGPKPARIGLPTYPFARERHWVPVGERIAVPKAPSDLRILQEIWSEEPLAQGSGQAIETLLCVTSDREHRQAIARWAAEGGDRPRVIFEQVAGDARADAVLYLEPLADPAAVADSFRIVDLLKQKPRKLILSGVHANEVERCHLDSWVGFGRSLGLVLPDTEVAVVFRDGASFAIGDWMRTLWAELQAPRLQSAWYRGGKRHVTRTLEIDLPAGGERPLRQGGVYLITGGCGGLGMIFAEHLARTYAAKLMLTGRSAPDDGIEAKLRRLRELGGEALYVPADVADQTAMREAVRQAQAWGRLDGVLHVAGISGAASVLQAEAAGFKQVLGAKVEGTLVLERVLTGLDLDFVCYFSSSSAILGDFGSCDYAVANRFQTAYARSGDRRIAINWPLWQDGGRSVGDAEQTRLYLESSGQRALTSSEGIRLFERLLVAGGSQYLLLTGTAPRPGPMAGDASLEECVSRDLKQEIHRLLKTRPEEILPRRNFVDFGFDSISLAEFSRVLSRFYALEISPSVFFSHSTLQRLTTYFLTEHRAAMEAFYARRDTPAVPLPASPVFVPPVAAADPDEPIAIVGMSGRFPKARNVDELWQLLAEGVDAVEEVPADRFDWRRYADKISSRWGGFIPGIAEFDPLFFEISPLEAERMDPRQRHLLQEAWLALEDAGYGAAEIARQRIGMFVGVEEGSDYQRRQSEISLTSTHNGVLASRLAYFLDLKGPVMAINTACSSGLVAAHTACQSLRQGECDAAIAAGVNLMVAPEAYVGMTQAGMLSPDGKCYVFDKRANGMVPGEAVAVVVLKRLSRALADGDPIHAVIRGSGINYDGRTNGITAPSGASQTELLRDVLARSRLGPQDIDYIVTHGTGTRLGDPVEINALYDAFKPGNDRQGYCALTSTKSNLGHTFAASGLVSLIGLVQAMRHRTIPASLHCEQESNYIQWKASPFYVNKRAKPWVANADRPRIGAVSAFGISGTNAHMIVQEHVREPVRGEDKAEAPCLLVLSAKNARALQEKIVQTITFLQSREAARLDLASVSHTLLQGRHHFEHRSAVVARSLDEAVEAWRSSLDRRGVMAWTFTGEATVRREIEALARRAPNQETLRALADRYCQGYDISWQGIAPCRVSLPGYPFSRKRYWLEDRAEAPPVRTISGFSYPEMARIVAERALGQRVTALGNMVWGLPAPSSWALSVRLHRADEDIAYSVGPENREGACFHLGEVVAGTAAVERPQPPGKADVSTLNVPDTERGAGVLFAPSLIEAAWRIVGGGLLPFSLRRIETFAPLPEQVTLHLVRKEGAAPGQRTVDMTFLDAEGTACLRLLDFTGAPREQLIDLASSD